MLAAGAYGRRSGSHLWLWLIAMALSVSTFAVRPAASAPDREQAIRGLALQCTSGQSSRASACQCYARAFIDSLTDGELANPHQTALVRAKMASARQKCAVY